MEVCQDERVPWSADQPIILRINMIRVVCALIENEGKTLVVQRGENMSLPYKWEFPGGKIEAGETEEACIQREIQEELGIVIKPNRRLTPSTHAYPKATIHLIPFMAEHIGGEIVLTEHKSYRWLRKDELVSLDWAEADIPIVNEYLTL